MKKIIIGGFDVFFAFVQLQAQQLKEYTSELVAIELPVLDVSHVHWQFH